MLFNIHHKNGSRPSPHFSRGLKVASLLAAALLISACANNTRWDKADSDLVEVARGSFDQVYMLPDQPMTRITRVAIADPVVEMSDYWLRDHRNNYTERDLERINSQYGKLLRDTVATVLSERSQIEIVEKGDADILLRPSLLNLNIYAPDLSMKPRTRDYVESAGNATFNLEFVDIESGQILAQFIDHRDTPPIVINQLEETNRATNNRLFRRLVERWSHNLVDYLDDQGIAPRR